jgi:hypothetical protein
MRTQLLAISLVTTLIPNLVACGKEPSEAFNVVSVRNASFLMTSKGVMISLLEASHNAKSGLNVESFVRSTLDLGEKQTEGVASIVVPLAWVPELEHDYFLALQQANCKARTATNKNSCLTREVNRLVNASETTRRLCAEFQSRGVSCAKSPIHHEFVVFKSAWVGKSLAEALKNPNESVSSEVHFWITLEQIR